MSNISNTRSDSILHIDANKMTGAFRENLAHALAQIGDQARNMDYSSLVDWGLKYAKEHPYLTTFEVTCIAATIAPGPAAALGLGWLGFGGGGVVRGSRAAAQQIPRVAAHGPFAVLQSAGAGGEPLGSAGDDDAGAVPDIDHHDESNTPERNEGDDSVSADHAEQTGDANAEEAETPNAFTSRDSSDSEAKSEGERDEKIFTKGGNW
ncbi:MAG: hypothetical protein LQ341_007708 [Variospora aurantia]|nr:MAG: hypothetical protein LQ341_007708 [Variospora aurantia]